MVKKAIMHQSNSCILLIATMCISRPSVTDAFTNSETNGAWPDLLRVAAMNRHCVALSRGRKKAELCFSAHVRKKGGRGAERGEDDLSRARLSGCRGGCSAGIYGIGEEWSSTARTLGDAPAQKRQSGLGRAGSRCYLRDAARLYTQPGHGATQRTHDTRYTDVCTHTVYVHTVN